MHLTSWLSTYPCVRGSLDGASCLLVQTCPFKVHALTCAFFPDRITYRGIPFLLLRLGELVHPGSGPLLQWPLGLFIKSWSADQQEGLLIIRVNNGCGREANPYPPVHPSLCKLSWRIHSIRKTQNLHKSINVHVMYIFVCIFYGVFFPGHKSPLRRRSWSCPAWFKHYGISSINNLPQLCDRCMLPVESVAACGYILNASINP